MRGKPVSVKGKEFPNASAAARHYGVPKNIVTEAIAKKNISAEEAINDYLARKAYCEQEFEGSTFRSMRALSKYVGIPVSSIKQRMKRDNLTSEQAIYSIKADKLVIYEAFGKSYNSIESLAKDAGVSPVALNIRINKEGKSPEDAINLIKYNQGKHAVKAFGVGYPSRSSAARAHGHNVRTINTRLKKGMDLESALKTPINSEKYNIITMNGTYGVVYKITNEINGKIYIGCTDNLKQRYKVHFVDHVKTIDRPLYVDMRKFGIENFTLEVVEKYDNRKAMLDGEIEWIAKLDCKIPKGYNLTKGGESGNMRTAVTVRDLYFISARLACEHFGLSYESTQSYKRQHNLTWKEAIEAKLASWISVDNQSFHSLNAFCKRFKISKETVDKYLNQGMSYQDIAHMPRHLTEVTWKGITYRSIAAACEAAKVNESNVRGRIRDNEVTAEEAIEYFVEKKNQITGYEVFGVHYETINDILAAFDLCFETYNKRRKKGMSIEEAVSTPKRILSVTVDKKTFRSIVSACRELNINEKDVYWLKKNGLSSEEAINAVLAGHSGSTNAVEFRGVKYPTKTALAKAYGRSLRSLNASLSKGTSLEDALLANRRVTVVEVEGKKYPNRAAAYDAYGLPRNKHHILNSWIRGGMTVDEAIKSFIEKD